MKPPNWLQTRGPVLKDGAYVIHLRVRIWHPGFWLFFIKTLIEDYREK